MSLTATLLLAASNASHDVRPIMVTNKSLRMYLETAE